MFSEKYYVSCFTARCFPVCRGHAVFTSSGFCRLTCPGTGVMERAALCTQRDGLGWATIAARARETGQTSLFTARTGDGCQCSCFHLLVLSSDSPWSELQCQCAWSFTNTVPAHWWADTLLTPFAWKRWSLTACVHALSHPFGSLSGFYSLFHWD